MLELGAILQSQSIPEQMAGLRLTGLGVAEVLEFVTFRVPVGP